MFPVFGRTIFYQGGEYGIAVLSKYPFLSVKTEPLPSPAGTKEQRAVLITEIQLPSGQNIRFASTHLDHSTDAVGSVMANALNDFFLKDDMPIIVGGDFNAKPDTGNISNEMHKWKWFCNNDPTSPDNPTSKIDYLFGYPKDKCRTIRLASICFENESQLTAGAATAKEKLDDKTVLVGVAGKALQNKLKSEFSEGSYRIETIESTDGKANQIIFVITSQKWIVREHEEVAVGSDGIFLF